MINYIEYDGRPIEIHSSRLDLIDEESKINRKIVMGVGNNYYGDSQIAEEIALSYLVRNASQIKPHRNMECITIIKEEGSYDPVTREARHVLTGFPTFKKNGQGN